MNWRIRCAAELTTKYSVGKDGKTANERLKLQPCNKPMVQFGEDVLYLFVDALNTDEAIAEFKMRDGIWLGIIGWSGEVSIGTDQGVVKRRTVKRRPEGQQWSGEAIGRMTGSAQQPVLGIQSDRIPTGMTGGTPSKDLGSIYTDRNQLHRISGSRSEGRCGEMPQRHLEY